MEERLLLESCVLRWHYMLICYGADKAIRQYLLKELWLAKASVF